MTNHAEEAAAKFRELVQSNLAEDLKNANEAETRLLVVDRVLAILGWRPEEYKPEKPTSSGRYTDYRLTIDGDEKLIVEAKRWGLIGPITKNLPGPRYQNIYLHKNCGEELSALLDQCRIYCSDCGIQYAVATTGSMWIVLVGYSTGVEWGKIYSFVFHSLEDISTRFNRFYDLLARENIKNNSFVEEFSSMLLVKPSFAQRPRSKILDILETGEVPHRRLVTLFFENFMGDITRDNRDAMLEYCYVESRETMEFSRDLRALLEYDAVLDEQGSPIDEVSESNLKDVIEYQLTTGNLRTILLVGRVGSGKSTFVHRFVKTQARPANHVCAVIDLIDRATVKVTQDRIEEQLLAERILNQLYDHFRDEFDPHEPSILRACFRREIDQFRTRNPELRQRKQEEYVLQEEKKLDELSQDKYKHLVGYARYLINKKYKIWVTLDNIDQGTDDYQAFIYAFAHRLSKDSGCVTLITMREDTFVEAQAAGFLNVRSSDFVFRLKSPELRQIIAKRRKYIEYILAHRKLPPLLSPHKRLVQILCWHIKELLLNPDDTLRKLISAFSLGNIRYSFEVLEDYYTSFHSLFHGYYNSYKEAGELPEGCTVDISKESLHFLQALMLGNDWSYDDRDSEIYNLFAVGQDEQSSHFIAVVILAYLNRDSLSPKSSVRLEKLYNDLVSLGYPKHHIEQVTRRLLRSSILLAPTIPVGMFKNKDVPELDGSMRVSISAKGYYYLNYLASNPYYQMRVAEDTIWYDAERVGVYIKALKDSLEVQEKHGSSDYMTATDAREVFIQYLRRAWQAEYQASKAKAQIEWARVVRSIVEEKVFGKQITQSVHFKEEKSAPETERPNIIQKPLPAITKKPKEDEPEQLTINFPTSPRNPEQVFQENARNLGTMPNGTKVNKSAYILKVLWAMELAFRCGHPKLRAADIAKLINDYGKGDVESTNVAKFFRGQRKKNEFTHLWSENPEGYFTINNFGRELLSSYLDGLT